MPAALSAKSAPLALICGSDDFQVKQRGRGLFAEWCAAAGGMDHETIEASAGTADEALKILARLHLALQTLPFFGGRKVIWLKDCNFLADDRLSTAAKVAEAVTELARTLKDFDWQGVRLLVTAGKVDKRKTFYKTLEKTGVTENYEALSVDDRDWEAKAAQFARERLKERGKQISGETLELLVQTVGPSFESLASEAEKLALYSADRPAITAADIAAVTTHQKQSRAFALADALGDRHLPRALQRLDEELWALQFDKKKSEIGLLYSLIAKVRALLLAKELLAEGLVRATDNPNHFKDQLAAVPPERFAANKKFSPLGVNPFPLWRASRQCVNYTRAELVRAMELLLDANFKLISTGLDEATVLQQVLIEIVGLPKPRPTAAALRPKP